jgi:nitronate monooxygenase
MDLQSLLGYTLPVIQAPMAGVQGVELAVAVSEAGGLGSLPCAMMAADDLRNALRTITEQTNKPFNVNFFCHRLPVSDPAREEHWRQLLAPFYQELGVVAETGASALRQPFNGDLADVLAEFEPPVVSFHFGLPSADLVARVKSWGARVISSATTVEEARWLAANGADAVIAQGVEAGGHRGLFLSEDLHSQLGTLALVPQVCAAVDIPVIAAGGIADAAGVAAAMALGASAVQVGTAFLLCPEAATSDVHRAALKSDAASVTALTNVFTGRPARSIVNRVIRELGPISTAAPAFPLAAAALTPLRATAESQGSGDFSPLWAGQNTSGCKDIPAADLVRALAAAVNA